MLKLSQFIGIIKRCDLKTFIQIMNRVSAKMAFNGHFYELLIMLLMHIASAYSECSTDTSSRLDYQLAIGIKNHAIKSHKMNDTLNSCSFGKYHNIFDSNACFDHCTLRRSNCLAVQTSNAGCRFCVPADYDPSRVETVDFQITYVTTYALESILSFIII